MSLSPWDAKQYAERLIRDHAKDVEFLTIHETWEYANGGELSNDDALAVADLISAAKVTVEWVE